MVLTFAAWKEGQVAPAEQTIEIVAAKPGPKPEPVSKRLTRALMHPNKHRLLVGLRFSPDGKQIIAGDYPGGVIQVWDAANGKQLTKIETGHGYRGSINYFFVSPDWKRVYVCRETRKAKTIERDGKQLLHFEYDGDIRAWDIASGKLVRTYRHNPSRGIVRMALSHDGRTILTGEHLSGVVDVRIPSERSLWDVTTGKRQALPYDRLEFYGTFSPDSRLVALSLYGKDNSTQAIKLFDVATARETISIPIREKNTLTIQKVFSPDGKYLIVDARVFPGKDNDRTWRGYFKVFQVATGTEVASLPLTESTPIAGMVCSPDGKTLAATTYAKKSGNLFLIDMSTLKLRRSVSFENGGLSSPPAFSPDGRLVVVAVRPQLEDRTNPNPQPEDVAQPRIYLIDAASGAVRDTIVSPPAFTNSVCFSPDGRILASDGPGKVLLWDVSDLTEAK